MAEMKTEEVVYEYDADGDTEQNFAADSNVEVVTDEFRTLAERGIKSGEGLGFGLGESRRPDQAEGFAAPDVYDATNNNSQTGTHRIVLMTSEGTVKDVIARIPSGKATVTRSDLPDGAALKAQAVMAKRFAGGGSKGYKVAWQFRASTNNGSFTWDYDSSNNQLQVDGLRAFE